MIVAMSACISPRDAKICSMVGELRTAIGAATIKPALLTCAKKLQYEGYLRRVDVTESVAELAKQGLLIREIVRPAGGARHLHVRALIIKIVSEPTFEACRGFLGAN